MHASSAGLSLKLHVLSILLAAAFTQGLTCLVHTGWQDVAHGKHLCNLFWICSAKPSLAPLKLPLTKLQQAFAKLTS